MILHILNQSFKCSLNIIYWLWNKHIRMSCYFDDWIPYYNVSILIFCTLTFVGLHKHFRLADSSSERSDCCKLAMKIIIQLYGKNVWMTVIVLYWFKTISRPKWLVDLMRVQPVVMAIQKTIFQRLWIFPEKSFWIVIFNCHSAFLRVFFYQRLIQKD